MFDIGQIVVCVEDYKLPHTSAELSIDVPNWCKKGEKYTIRGFLDAGFVVGVYLEEIVNPPKYFRLVDKTYEPAFRVDRFRALTESELEVSIEKEEELFV